MALLVVTALLLLMDQAQAQDDPPDHVVVAIGHKQGPYGTSVLTVENPDGEICLALPDHVGSLTIFWSL
jgi:hypothetical protein